LSRSHTHKETVYLDLQRPQQETTKLRKCIIVARRARALSTLYSMKGCYLQVRI